MPKKRPNLTCSKKTLSKATRDKAPKVKSLKSLKKQAWDLLSKCIRLGAADFNGLASCFTCNIEKPWKELQAGHGISGRGNAVLFEEKIIRVQCYRCNMHLGGNYKIFVPKLIREIGQEEYENIEKMSHLPIKRKPEWYVDKIEELKNRLSILKTDFEEALKT